jgi:phage terminase large subunit GpA-like protein
MLIGFPNEKEGKQFVRTRIDPMIDYNPFLKERIGTSRKGASGSTTDYKEFPGGFLKRATGEAASSFMSTMCRIVWLDEYDAFRPTSRARGAERHSPNSGRRPIGDAKKIVVSSNTDQRGLADTRALGEHRQASLLPHQPKGYSLRA